MSKLSLKIGLLFFLCVALIEAILFYTLYASLVNDQVNEVMDNLLARGETHSAVLAESFTDETLTHVAMMESASAETVIVTDAAGGVLAYSDSIEPEMKQVLEETDFQTIVSGGHMVEPHWHNKQYIASDSPIVSNGAHIGHVFMFSDTETIERMVNHLQRQFIVAGLAALLFSIAAIMGLSRFITRPLIRMKKATESLSKGEKVTLVLDRNDELGELAAAITKLSDDLAQLKRDRNDFLGSISHELRTPLTYINGYTTVLARPGLENEQRQAYIRIVQEETERLTAFIGQLFELAKMDDHTFRVQKQSASSKELIATVTALVAPLFKEEGKTLTVKGKVDITLWMDKDRMTQVLLNVLDNARKYSEAGTETVIWTTETKTAFCFHIQDEGTGIPEQDQPFVFDRLYRVDKSRSRASGGFGIGLSVAKEIVEAHGGTIKMASEQGKGTEVIIELKKGDV